MSVYPTPVKNFYSSSEIEAADGIVNVINRPIVLKSLYLNVSDQVYDSSSNSYTVKMFDGTDEVLRIYDADNSVSDGEFGSLVTNFSFRFPQNGMRILNSLAFSIANTNASQPFVVESISVMYQG